MHIVIPYAAPSGASIQQTLDQVQLPNLRALLKRLAPAGHITGTPADLTPLHERLMAQQRWPGLTVSDGQVPWAAAEARACAFYNGQQSWARLTLCHWVAQADHVAMDDPTQLQVTDHESHTLQDAMRAYFAEDGITLHTGAGGTWLAQGEIFKNLPTASLDRVRGNKVDGWIPRQPQAKPLRRLQNEMQMLLYTHPVNDARVAKGLSSINAFWVSATGDLPGEPGVEASAVSALQLHDDLRAAAYRDDASAWLQAWQALDVGPIAQLLRSAALQPVSLTLCGDHAASTFTLRARNLWTRIASQFDTPDIQRLLKSL